MPFTGSEVYAALEHEQSGDCLGHGCGCEQKIPQNVLDQGRQFYSWRDSMFDRLGLSIASKAPVAQRRARSPGCPQMSRHESGHCAVILDRGGIIDEVCANAPNGGYTRFDRRTLTLYATKLALIAGSVATGSPLLSDVSGAQSDRERLWELHLQDHPQLERRFLGYPPQQLEKVLMELSYVLAEDAQEILSCRHAFVDDLALLLTEWGVVSGADVHRLWNEHYG